MSHTSLVQLRTRRFARWLRFLVACLAFVALRPAPAVASARPEILLVAPAYEAREHGEDEATDDECTSASPLSTEPSSLLPLRAPRSTRAPVARIYLRNCSLLR